MHCQHYDSKKCVSCPWLDLPYHQQIEHKQQKLQQALSDFNPQKILPAALSEQKGFRNKAKMAVLGTVEAPILGIKTGDHITDLCDCMLYSQNMQQMLVKLKKLIKDLMLVPYNLNRKKGELKFIIVTEANGKFMLRFVLNSSKYLEKLKSTAPLIQSQIEQVEVITANIQPKHAAILEGDEEFILTEKQELKATLNDIPLFIKKGSFFQTNTAVAKDLYLTAKTWLSTLQIEHIWDLFCGVGGFGLHCALPSRKLIGIEINAEAILCAKKSAKKIGYQNLSFSSLDATTFALKTHMQKPDVILVNPPRRGLTHALTKTLEDISPNYILYSSCNLTTLMSDLHQLPRYSLDIAQLFDMFPHTEHMEVLVLLKRNTDLH